MLRNGLREQHEDDTGGEAVRKAECSCACRVVFESVTLVLLGESCGYFMNMFKAVVFPSLLIRSSFLPFNLPSGAAVGRAVRVIHIG